MSRVKYGRTLLMALTALGAGSVLLPAGDASADSAQVMRLAYGVGGPQKAKGGAGHEQPSSVVLTKGGIEYVVTVYMSSNVSDKDRPWQCKCSSVAIDPMQGPVIVADQIQLGHYDGDRPCNHPMAATDGQHVVWMFGSDMNNQANVSTYAGVLDEMCQVEADPQRVSEDNNNNEGAPDISYNGKGYFTGGYLSTGNNDTSYAVGLLLHDDNGKVSLEKTYLTGIVSPSNIGRPAIMAAGPDRSLFCASKGDNRPPEIGIECAWLDAIAGKPMWKKIVAASDPNNKKYMNQPSVAALDYGRFAVNLQESNGGGKKNNTKGANTSHLYVIEPSDSGYVEKSHKVGVGTYQTHAAVCAGAYGVDGLRHIAIMGAPNTGVGLPGIQFARYDSQTDLVADKTMQWAIGYYGDSGYIANIYGQNPNQQGRDFLRCIGDVPNPGHGLKGGYQSGVASFFVAPHAGRIPGDPKNALFLSFVPGKTDKPALPEPPKEVTPPTPDPSSTATTASSSSSSGGGGSDSGAGGSSGAGEVNGSFPSGQSGACSIGTPGSSSGGNAALAFVGLAVAILSLRNRKEA
jgi:hypothetical protein